MNIIPNHKVGLEIVLRQHTASLAAIESYNPINPLIVSSLDITILKLNVH